MSDFILTMDSDPEDYAPGPSFKRKQTKKTNGNQTPSIPNGDADGAAEDIALDDGFTFDIGGGMSMNGRNLKDGVDFWGAEEDEVKGGQAVRILYFDAVLHALSDTDHIHRASTSTTSSPDASASQFLVAKSASGRGTRKKKAARMRMPRASPKKMKR